MFQPDFAPVMVSKKNQSQFVLDLMKYLNILFVASLLGDAVKNAEHLRVAYLI